MESAHLHHIVGNCAVLRLNTQTWDDVLMLQGPGDKVVTQEYRAAWSGPVSVRTIRSISISVDNKLRCRDETKKQTMVDGVPEVAEDALCRFEVGLTRLFMRRHTWYTA
jgi:hypothetical protein